MKKLFLFITITVSTAFSAQTLIQAYQKRTNQITQTNIDTYLAEFASYGIKSTGSTNNNNAFNWLKNKYLAFGYSESQISENAFSYNGNTTKNLILTKTGTTYPNTYVIVCAHYDTIGGPGVNDNGSGTAVLLEMARILKDVTTEYSIKFINFTGEEQGLKGSQNYVSTVVNATNPKMNIKLVFNIDQVGGVAGKVNNKINCERDTNNSPSTNNEASAAVTQELMNCVSLYSTLQPNLSYAYASDYMPFQANNEVITGFYEYTESTKPHTSGDTLANMDPTFVFNVAKAALGAVQHFSVADLTFLSAADCPPEKMLSSLKIFPNPTSTTLFIDLLNLNLRDFSFTISDFNGKTLLKKQNEKVIDVSQLPNGVYLGTLQVEDQYKTQKIVVQK